MKKRSTLNKRITGVACGMLLVSGVSAEVIFQNNFETGIHANERVFSKEFSSAYPDAWQNTNNWGVHHESTNPALDDGGLSGKVLGHITANYDYYERSAYEITVDFTNWDAAKTLSFDFDSWIQDDGNDGFNVIAYNGLRTNLGLPATGSTNSDSNEMDGSEPAGWAVLNPLAGSDMLYDADPVIAYTQLDEVSGDRFSAFTGHNPSAMTGVALFDLSGFTGVTTIRFSFGSGSVSVAEGINIDNVVIAGTCTGTTGGTTGSTASSVGGATCTPTTPPPSGIPEPTSLALAAIGLVALRRKGLLALKK